jgi:outer membrane receptor protein involved in Fe transport
MDREEKAWQLPGLEASFEARYTFKEKYTVNGEVFFFDKRFAKVFNDTTPVTTSIDGAIDLNLGFEYRITGQLSAFASVNNILNQKYMRWYNYPVQGIQGMLGVTYSF